MTCSYLGLVLFLIGVLFITPSLTQPTGELIESDPRASYCSENSCVRVYCKSPAQRWSCQANKYYALEVEQVCDYFLKTWNEFTSNPENFDNDDVRSVVLPWCGSKSPPSGYNYVGYYKDRLCPSSWPIRTNEVPYRHWSECD